MRERAHDQIYRNGENAQRWRSASDPYALDAVVPFEDSTARVIKAQLINRRTIAGIAIGIWIAVAIVAVLNKVYGA